MPQEEPRNLTSIRLVGDEVEMFRIKPARAVDVGEDRFQQPQVRLEDDHEAGPLQAFQKHPDVVPHAKPENHRAGGLFRLEIGQELGRFRLGLVEAAEPGSVLETGGIRPVSSLGEGDRAGVGGKKARPEFRGGRSKGSQIPFEKGINGDQATDRWRDVVTISLNHLGRASESFVGDIPAGRLLLLRSRKTRRPFT